MAATRDKNNIKPFSAEQALFINTHRKNHPEQKISDFQEYIKKEFNLRKKPSIHQIQQCMKFAAKMFQYESRYATSKNTDDKDMDSLVEMYGYSRYPTTYDDKPDH